MRNNYTLSPDATPFAESQTDFGHIYFNKPAQSPEPRDMNELATLLQHYHKLGQQVTIRNTGHSVNGQTLTAGVQVNIGKIKHVSFDKENMTVTAGAGCSWHEVLECVGFPDYCLPIFPNNPGQKIHVGGTASVGGIGAYSSKLGGFWNHVVGLKLVTMTGEIISCDLEHNFELMQYSLGGFGRIGVIGEITIKVVPSQRNVLNLMLTHHTLDSLFHNLDLVAEDSTLAAALWQVPLHSNPLMAKVMPKYTISFVTELKPEDDFKIVAKRLLSRYKHDLAASIVPIQHQGEVLNLDFDLLTRTMPKQDMVYYYPNPTRAEPADYDLHPWNDYILDGGHIKEFAELAKQLVHQYGLVEYLVKEGSLRGMVDFPILPVYLLSQTPDEAKRMPLTFALPNNAKQNYGLGIMPNLPKSKLSDAMEVAQILTNTTYEMQGKRYLYGIHDLTSNQVEQHFGRDVLEKWQQLKDQLDPKHLLNIDVIEHLDN